MNVNSDKKNNKIVNNNSNISSTKEELKHNIENLINDNKSLKKTVVFLYNKYMVFILI